MKIALNMLNSFVTPINILKIAKRYRELKKGDELEIVTKDENTVSLVLKIFKCYNPLISEESLTDSQGYYHIILKK